MTSSTVGEKVFCKMCKVRTNHGILKSHTEQCDYSYDDFFWVQNYYIVKCLGCDTVAFVTEYHDESMITHGEFGEQEEEYTTTVYPEEPKISAASIYKPHEHKQFITVPKVINDLYVQIVRAYNSESYILSTTGLRILIEGICRDFKIKDGYLVNIKGEKVTTKKSGEEKVVRSTSIEGKINGLLEKELIIQSQAKVLHDIRELGNASVHELKEPNKKTIILAINILEKIMDQVYDFSQYGGELKKT